jgi:predicted nuclease with RNAse H fold
VWTDGAALRVIETYPAACRLRAADSTALAALAPVGHDDLTDARVCALVAHLFALTPEAFDDPPEDVPVREGWIWVPKPGKLEELLTGRARRI